MKRERCKVNFEISRAVNIDFLDGLNKGLKRLGEAAEDTVDLVLILQNVVRYLYRLQPDGRVNYAEKNYKLAEIYVGGYNGDILEPGKVEVSFHLNDEIRKCYGGDLCTINLRGETYTTRWKSENYDSFARDTISETLMIDTENVMKCLGLEKRVEEENTPKEIKF